MKDIANSLHPIKWESENLGYLECPGITAHTKPSDPRDCRITLGDGKPPTIFCFHSSCESAVADANKTLRRALAKAEPVKYRPAPRPAPVSAPVEKITIEPIQPPAALENGLRKHLEACFTPDEYIAIIYGVGNDGKPASSGFTILRDAPFPQQPKGTFIRVNPMTDGGTGNADVTAWRHCLLESDSASIGLQWAAIQASGLPISVVIHSGGKSLHAWCRVDAPTAIEFTKRAKQAADCLESFEGMKIDRACLNSSRMARLAGCARFAAQQTLISLKLGAASWDEWVQPEPTPAPTVQHTARPFMILGQLNRVYYYMSKTTCSLVALTTAQHSRGALLELAPLAWWEAEYELSGDRLIAVASDDLIQKAAAVQFDPLYLRGRGAWLDDGRVVFHAGNQAFVDGVKTDLFDIKSRYVYAMAARIRVDLTAPMPCAESRKLQTLLDCFQFQESTSSLLLGGWLVNALICGALDWRAHIWLTGSAGSGKTTVLGDIIAPLLGEAALNIQGNTSEAGIRQELSSDARPVIFDEAEGDDESSKTRMANVVALARASSREGGAVMLKGSAGGKSQSFRVRSSFLFASIGVSLEKRADQGRITVLELLPEHLRVGDNYPQARALIAETTSQPDWCARFRTRCITMAGTIARAVPIFTQAIRPILDEQRSADQIGTLLAGAYALQSDSTPTPEQANEWVRLHDWQFAKLDKNESDERRLLNKLVESWVTVEQRGTHIAAKQTVGETIRQATCIEDDLARFAHDALDRIGIKVRECGSVDVAVSGTELANRIGAVRWSDQFSRYPGAERMPNAQRFAGVLKRFIRLPSDLFEQDALS
jgi:putative DNA primase/helicase